MRKTVVIAAFALIAFFATYFEASADTGWLYTITSISIDKPEVQWGDDVKVTITYAGDKEPTLGAIHFRNNDITLSNGDGIYNSIGTQFVFPADEYDDSSKRATILSHSYDSDNKTGTLSLRVHIPCEKMTGEYVFQDICFEEWNEYSLPPDCRMDYSSISPEDTTITIISPLGGTVFDKEYSDEDLQTAIADLKDGDVAIIRGQILEDEFVPEGKRIPDVSGNNYLLIKKEYLDAIKGENITLLFPTEWDFFTEINGITVTDETNDAYLTMRDPYLSETEDGEMIILLEYPNNGTLPASINYWYEYINWYRLLLFNSTEPVSSTSDFDQFLANCEVYFNNSGTLQEEHTQIEQLNKWVGFGLTHNSSFLVTDAKVSKLRSFNAYGTKTMTFTGKILRPKLTIMEKDAEADVHDYKVNYSSKTSKAVGSYSVTVSAFRHGYGAQKLGYTIVPKGTSFASIKGKKKAAVVNWKKQTAKMTSKRITGYMIQYSTSKKNISKGKTVTVKGYKKNSKKIKKLKSKKTYYMRVRTYMTINSKTYYSSWSKIKSVRAK